MDGWFHGDVFIGDSEDGEESDNGDAEGDNEGDGDGDGVGDGVGG